LRCFTLIVQKSYIPEPILDFFADLPRFEGDFAQWSKQKQVI